MRLRIRTMKIVMAVSALWALVALTVSSAQDKELPWAFRNGEGDGYSVEPVSADPVPGTRLCAGEMQQFTVVVRYVLEAASDGKVVLVAQDEMNKQIPSESRRQFTVAVRQGRGEVKVSDTFRIPDTSKELWLYIPLVPAGLERTSGELVLRYPISLCEDAAPR